MLLKKLGSLLLAMTMVCGMMAGPVKAQEYTSEGAVEAESLEAAQYGLFNPRITWPNVDDHSEMVTWDLVTFGNYPQAEVISGESYGSVTNGVKPGDVIVDAALYNALQNATGWDAQGDIVLDGIKYRRISYYDSIYGHSSPTGQPANGYNWKWNDANVKTRDDRWPDRPYYHFFKYEPIKWRVLSVANKKILLLADQILDSHFYNFEDRTAVTWETCTLRSWLNGYEIPDKAYGSKVVKRNFIDSAFSENEKAALVNQKLVNADNKNFGTDGGNDTVDKVFLLAEDDVDGWRSDCNARKYGMSIEYLDHSGTMAYGTSYAKAMGISCIAPLDYSSSWMLRTPGGRDDYAAYADSSANMYGENCILDYAGVRPAVVIDTADIGLLKYEGTVSIDGSVTTDCVRAGGTHHFVKNVLTTAGWKSNGTYMTECDVCKRVKEKGTIKGIGSVKLSVGQFEYTGNVQRPKVVVKDTDGKTISSTYYTVKWKTSCKTPGEHGVTTSFKGMYEGSFSNTFTIVPKGTSISSITASSKGFTVKWKKQATQTSGYQIRYSTSSSMSGAKTVTVSKNTTLYKKITKLKGKKRYYVQVRTYKTVSGKKYCSKWSAKKYVTTKA